MESWSEDMDMRINAAVAAARNFGIVRPLDDVIIITGSIAGAGNTNTMQVFQESFLLVVVVVFIFRIIEEEEEEEELAGSLSGNI
ncbi:unnamed protein product [Rodentolepis nana]|uniref:Pyruvate kinase C-terminal domain-containing protein n=1 Tax=Rodentolepis nana TaxID=102285 RepID=A0A3P7V858_RODNA|nr:unnamed protein product [Rodentolepis nana]